MELIETIKSLIEEGEKLLPLGGNIASGYSGKHQSDYVAWRLRTIAMLKRLGNDAEPFLKDLDEDEQGPYFYTSSVRRVLGALKGALAVAEIQTNIKESNQQQAEEAVSKELFSMDIVKGARGYVKEMAKQANGCYRNGWYDACAVMVRRLLEILIIDSFEDKGKLNDIREMGYFSLPSQVSEPPTASEVRRFRQKDFPQLETALNDVQVSLCGRLLTDYSAASNWKSLTSRFADWPNDISAKFDMVIETRDHARGGTTKPTRKQLLAAKRGIIEILGFLRQRFPRAGIDSPDQGEIVSLTRLIEKYLAVPETYWHVERTAKPALWKIKTIGDIGAHGRYGKVIEQTLLKYQDTLVAGIQQLVGTAYPK